jgi:hypothetical protein
MQRTWQVAHDVADAADLAARQRPVFGRKEDDVSLADRGAPG